MIANLALLSDICAKLLDNDEDWFHQNLIEWSDKGSYYILNYNQFGPPNQHNILCRGLVIDKQGAIASLPFTRFFNLGQKEAAPVQIDNAEVIEKLDGTLVCVFWPKNVDVKYPVYHTRRMISCHPADLEISIKSFATQHEAKFMREIGKLVGKIKFDPADRNFVFMFEAVMPMTKVVTDYPPEKHGLYLIGMRDMRDFRELDEDELDDYGGYLCVKRPKRWSTATSEEDVVKMMEGYPDDFEGFVVRDKKSGFRVKVKKKSYLERHRLLSKLTYRHLIPLYFAGERGEIEVYMPPAKELFDKIEHAYENLVQSVVADVTFWKGHNFSRKDLAQRIVGHLPKERCHFIFKFIDTPFHEIKDGVEKHIHDYVKNNMVDPVARWLQLDADKELAKAPEEL